MNSELQITNGFHRLLELEPDYLEVISWKHRASFKRVLMVLGCNEVAVVQQGRVTVTAMASRQAPRRIYPQYHACYLPKQSHRAALEATATRSQTHHFHSARTSLPDDVSVLLYVIILTVST